ncbi:MAG: hypothetical protein QOC77_296 [Thermoleophilaceae bacterium]|nr:hypothetical protein [Thermoleophilaceae bacterium]
MSAWAWIAIATLAVYAAAVLALLVAGRGSHARALAGFVPDCARLFKRLAADPRVSRRHKTALVLAVGYLAMPIDLVPDFIPVAGQLDDAILAAIVLRSLVRAAGPDLIATHWPGPRSSLAVVLSMAAA